MPFFCISRKPFLLWLTLAIVTLGVSPLPRPKETERASRETVSNVFSNLPLSFELNKGQADPDVRFLARGPGYNMMFTPTGAALVFAKSGSVLRWSLIGAHRATHIAGLSQQPGEVHYLIGSDPAGWRTNVTTYAKVKYEDVYDGVDLVYYGNQKQLEYDFIVGPGVSPETIRLRFEGHRQLSMDADGNLIVRVEGEEIQIAKPHIYQNRGVAQKEIEGEYILERGDQIGFRVSAYDRSAPLIIDPVLVYSTYFGGSLEDEGRGIAVDGSGNIYITGLTYSTNLSLANPLRGALGGGANVTCSPSPCHLSDAFVAKLDPSGTALIYSTYLGGSFEDEGRGIAVDASGSVYLTGVTQSFNFPTANAVQRVYAGGQDAFVAKLNAAGSALVYSTYLGGRNSDNASAIAVDNSFSATITGNTDSTDFPIANALQPVSRGSRDAFVTRLDAAGRALVYSTYLGGGNIDESDAVALDSSGNVYITGRTGSTDFPTINPFQRTIGGGDNDDAFIAKLNAAGSALVYSTYLGGSGGEWGRGIAVDILGNTYVTGYTFSTNFPTLNPFQAVFGLNGRGDSDGFVTKLNATGAALVYSTYLGGSQNDSGRNIAVDISGNAYVTGYTASADFPVLDSLVSVGNRGLGYVTKLNAAGTGLTYSTYLESSSDFRNAFFNPGGGGIALDRSGNVYVTSSTVSTGFPIANALQPAIGGLKDAFVTKIGDTSPPSPRAFGITDRGSASLTTAGGSPMVVGYARMQANAGSTTPAGVAIFGLRTNNVLVSEAGVPASPLIQNGRIYAEVSGPVNTGLAIANPNDQTANITFSFTRSDGTDFGGGSTTVPASGQVAKFLNEAPFSSGNNVQGTFTFSSDLPIAVVALRGLTNERGEFLITTLPVLDTAQPAGTTAAILPHFADGGGWTTQIILVNPADSTMNGNIQFLGTTGTATTLTAGGAANSTFAYSIPRRSSFKLATAGGGTSTRSGSVRVVPNTGDTAPTSLAVFSYKPAGVTVAEAGVPSIQGTAFRMYVEASGALGAMGSIQSGIAVANPATSSATVNLELFRLDGTSAGLTGSLSVPGSGQAGKFLNELFPALTLPFQGVLRISTTSPAIAVVGLRARYNERNDFLITTTPPASEAAIATAAELVFPHLADGGGYTTQFVLFSGSAGQISIGTLRVLSQSGQVLNLFAP